MTNKECIQHQKNLGRPFKFHETQWIEIDKNNHIFVDGNHKVLASVQTPLKDTKYQFKIWDVEISEESHIPFISLYLAKMYVQRVIFARNNKPAIKKVNSKSKTEKKLPVKNTVEKC